MSKISLRQIVGSELQRRHGYHVMESKIKPVHIANALMRAEHEVVGRMNVLGDLFVATTPSTSPEEKFRAVTSMLDEKKERWGELAESQNLKDSALVNKVLPLLRALLGADSAAYGKSPNLSSFSSPTVLTATGDPSDDGAGLFVFRLWNGVTGSDRLDLLDLFRKLTAPDVSSGEMDDLSALFAPLVDGTRPRSRKLVESEDLKVGYSKVELTLRDSADRLSRYEYELSPNPIASIQRVVLLAALSIFHHGATRWCERGGGPLRYLLLDATTDPFAVVAMASTKSVAMVLQDAGEYMASVIDDLLKQEDPNWIDSPIETLNRLLLRLKADPVSAALAKGIADRQNEGQTKDELRVGILDELVRDIEHADRRGLDGYLRLLGVRSGFLYPQQKNPNKRLNPSDRTLEVLVASTIDAKGAPMEYRDFLQALRDRWHIIVGGAGGDGQLLSQGGTTVPARHLRENSERFLDRLVALGFARRLADSVAVVGMMGVSNV